MQRGRVLALAALLVTATTSAGGPPADVLRRANAALSMLDGDGFSGSYLMTVRVKVDAPGSEDDEDSVEVHEVTISPDGTKVSRLVKAVEGGRDVTRQRLAAAGGEERETHGREDRGEIDVEMLPLGRRAADYAFSAPTRRDGLLVARFRPVAKVHEDDELLSEGELAWDPASGDPVWIDLDPADNPPFVSKLHLRFEFATSEGTLHLSRMETVTRAGIPLILRVRADISVEISEVRSAAPLA